MQTLRFAGDDIRWVFEILVEACEVTQIEGERPAIVINGKKFEPFDLVKVAALLPADDLLPHHQMTADSVFKAKQRGYRRTAFNLAHRANAICADCQLRKARDLD